LILVINIGCNTNNSVYHIRSTDNKNCVTIITQNNNRYIIEGENTTIPDDNFIKLDLKNIDREIGDEIVGCWNKDGYKWIIFNDNAIVIENKLDSTKYLFKNRLPVNKNGIPSLEGYIEGSCFDLGFSYSKIIHKRGNIAK